MQFRRFLAALPIISVTLVACSRDVAAPTAQVKRTNDYVEVSSPSPCATSVSVRWSFQTLVPPNNFEYKIYDGTATYKWTFVKQHYFSADERLHVYDYNAKAADGSGYRLVGSLFTPAQFCPSYAWESNGFEVLPPQVIACGGGGSTPPKTDPADGGVMTRPRSVAEMQIDSRVENSVAASTTCSGSGGTGPGGVAYSPGETTGGQTVTFDTGVGTGTPSACGSAATVQKGTFEIWYNGQWVQKTGYYTTC